MGVDKSLNVLVVDEHREILELHRSLLKDMGFTSVRTAASGREALHKLKAADYSMVIADWRLEPMSGLELLQAIRADPELKTLPFIMITAENRKERVVQAEQAGADGCIVKPFNAEALSERIARVMGG